MGTGVQLNGHHVRSTTEAISDGSASEHSLSTQFGFQDWVLRQQSSRCHGGPQFGF
jgi:hypothetical protein